MEHASIDGNYFGSWSLRRVRSGESLGECSSCAFSDLAIARLRKQLTEGLADKAALRTAQNLNHPQSSYVVLLLVAAEQPPVSQQQTFIAGQIAGRAYLYAERQHRFVCAGDLEATNSPTVKTRFRHMKNNILDEQSKSASAAAASLQRDLEVQLRTAVTHSLRALLPKE